MALSADDFQRFADTKEVLIETRRDARAYQTVIWVVDDDGTLFIRSYLGDNGKWYQRALVDPNVALIADDTRASFLAVPAADSESIERASEGFRRKYANSRSLGFMVVPAVLPTTMRLDPV